MIYKGTNEQEKKMENKGELIAAIIFITLMAIALYLGVPNT